MSSKAGFCFVILAAVFLGLDRPTVAGASVPPIVYPPTPRTNATDTYFGTTVPDPYRWLEQTQSPQVRKWVSLETELTEKNLATLPDRETLRSLMLGLFSTPMDYVPQKGTYATVFGRDRAGATHTILMVIRNGRTSVLFDPAKRWHDSSKFLVDWMLSPDGRTVAYATNVAGLGWVRWHTLDTASGADETGTVLGVPDWGSISWARDSSGFYYGGYGSELPRKPGLPVGDGYRVFFHRVRAPQSADSVVYDHADHPDWLAWANESWDGRYLILTAYPSSGENGNLVAIRDLGKRQSVTAVLRQPGSGEYDYVDNDGTVFYFFTNSKAPRGKLVAIDLRDPSSERDVIPERSDVLQAVNAVGGRFTTLYLRDVNSLLEVFGRSGRLLHSIALPGVGSASDVSGNADDPIGYYRFSSLTQPPTVFSYDVRTNESRMYSQAGAPFDPARYVTEELFATSTGGARIPVFIAHRRDIKLDGTSPTLLTGYGGFGDSYTPVWQNFTAAWLARGGAVAIACVRGGGEYGETWHRAGMLADKQNAFDDFAAAADLLIERGFASHSTLAAYGYSGGGLLVGVTEVQHPALFAAVAEEAGPVDVLRGYTYGSESAWTGEVGSPVANASQFKWLYSYAPLVAIRKGASYPATLVMTSENDERVSPAHSYKFAATLQWAQAGPNPILLYVAKNRGHVKGAKSAISDTLADTESFLLEHTTTNP
jgi:prolyl oligopeptidase